MPSSVRIGSTPAMMTPRLRSGLFLLALIAGPPQTGRAVPRSAVYAVEISPKPLRSDVRGGRTLFLEDFGAVPDSSLGIDLKPPFAVFEDGVRSERNLRREETRPPPDDLSDDELAELTKRNTAAFNAALSEAREGDRVVLRDGESFSFTGGVRGTDLEGVVVDFAGSARFVRDLRVWPFDRATSRYLPAIHLVDGRNVTLTSSSTRRAELVVDAKTNEIGLRDGCGRGGIVDGGGKPWWDDTILGTLPLAGESRPNLVHVQSSTDVIVEGLTLINSPFWSLTVEAVGADIRHVNVLIDRNYQRALKESRLPASAYDTSKAMTMLYTQTPNGYFSSLIPKWMLQPEDLNTDGIDVRGTNIKVHDCIVYNDDDSIAVKPPIHGNKTTAFHGTIPYNCTKNILLENLVLTGFGASVGSVGPNAAHACVDRVIFRNISMPGTGKGIYIKGNRNDCHGGVSSQITNIRYEDIHILQPFWWPIWIGPQAQHQPHTSLQGSCPLVYPFGRTKCPTQGCTTFENITIKNVLIEDPLLSPGVILGNSSNPMKNVVFYNVTVKMNSDNPLRGRFPFHANKFPFQGAYQCKNADFQCQDCHPLPSCSVDTTT